MIPIRLDKEESVLVAGNFTREDIKALHDNPTLLSAKVSYIRNAVVNLYVKGYTTFVFTTTGLFDLLVASVVNDFHTKGMSLSSVFVNRYPGMKYTGARQPEEFSHMSFCFSGDAEEFDPTAFDDFLNSSIDCVLSPSRIKKRGGYLMPEIMNFDRRSGNALN